MQQDIKLTLGRHLIRYAASTQILPLVMLHGVWLLFAVLTWGDAAASGSGVDRATDAVWKAYLWLGGVDADGHGDLDNLLQVWAKLSLPVYLLDAIVRRLLGERAPLGLARIALLSGVMAVLGFGLAIWPLRAEQGAGWWMLIWIAVLGMAAALAALWAALARRIADWAVAAMLRPPASVEAPSASH